MSKQFEEEYKALADREAPDLWARIEAGLTPKSTAPDNTDVKEIKSFQVFLKRYAGLAAAILCVAILLPSVLLVSRIGGGKNYSGAPAYEAAADDDIASAETAEAEFEEAAPAGMAVMTDEAPACEAAADEDTAPVYEAADTVPVYEEAADNNLTSAQTAGSAVSENAAADTAAVTEMADAGNRADSKASKEKEEALRAAVQGSGEEAAILENVVVKVLKNRGMDLTEGEEDPDRTGTVYTVEIVEDPSGSLKAGTRVDVLLSVFYSSYPAEGSSCKMKLQRVKDSEVFAYLILGWQAAQ